MGTIRRVMYTTAWGVNVIDMLINYSSKGVLKHCVFKLENASFIHRVFSLGQ
jgi:hypothetical protein